MNSTKILILIVMFGFLNSYGSASAVVDTPDDVKKILTKEGPGLTYLGRVESKRFFHVNDTMTWHDAGRECKEMGMDLVTIENQAEYNFLNLAEYPTRLPNFWISARDDNSRAQYRWTTSGQPLGDFGQWKRESHTDFICIFMSVPNGGWREWGCNYGETVVCQLG